jgi:hypothetical protein
MALPELYSQLVDKVASQGIPAWLGVGGSNGDIIPEALPLACVLNCQSEN